ncbi:MAG: GMC family oxidoreductase [Candidatus Binataceae bacterium]
MKESYDAIVIGTGFGGAVAACRLAQAGLKVGVIERGRRYPMQGFPRDPANGWLWPVDQGLFDIRMLGRGITVQAAGLGGGSLVYSNVHLRAPQFAFESGWPAGYSRAMLEPYYDLVAYMLDIAPITSARFRALPPKTRVMERAARQLGRAEKFCYPNLAVDFHEPGQLHTNKFGVEQQGCTYCGECTLGCNVHAKNTLDLNYLALAQRYGADITTLCEVSRIERLEDGYKVFFGDHGAQGATGSSQARAVFVCAGAVNSTELLLRCRDEFKTLPKLSGALGHGCSANGDIFAFAFATKEAFEPSDGPIITTALLAEEGAGSARSWFVVEEGGYAKELRALTQVMDRGASLTNNRVALASLTALARRAFVRPKTRWAQLLAELSRRGLKVPLIVMGALSKRTTPSNGADDTAVFLIMGYDHPTGILELSPIGHRLRGTWDVARDLHLYRSEQKLSAELAKAMGARLRQNPFSERLRYVTTVHCLGGCVMADQAGQGVTDAEGEVHGYPGLYVLDGASLPASTGVNPSSTIAAVAERNIERAIRKLAGHPYWQAPEMAAAPKIKDPMTS